MISVSIHLIVFWLAAVNGSVPVQGSNRCSVLRPIPLKVWEALLIDVLNSSERKPFLAECLSYVLQIRHNLESWCLQTEPQAIFCVSRLKV